jgi:hypothetical protein
MREQVPEPQGDATGEARDVLELGPGETEAPSGDANETAVLPDGPVYDVELAHCTVGVGDTEDGRKVLVFGPVRLRFIVPLAPNAAKGIGEHLQRSLMVATSLQGVLAPDAQRKIEQAAAAALAREGKAQR